MEAETSDAYKASGYDGLQPLQGDGSVHEVQLHHPPQVLEPGLVDASTIPQAPLLSATIIPK